MQTVSFIRVKGLNHQQFQSFMQEIDSEYANILYHKDVFWLSRGKVLNRAFEPHKEICQFMDSKEKKWKRRLAFLADITAHLSALNLQLQRRDHITTHMYDAVKAAQAKLLLWQTRMHQCNLPHFPCCQVMLNQVGATRFPNAHFADKLSALRTDFSLETLKHKKMLSCLATHLPTTWKLHQMELRELQCNEQ